MDYAPHADGPMDSAHYADGTDDGTFEYGHQEFAESPYSPTDDTTMTQYEGHNVETFVAVESCPDTELDEEFRLFYTQHNNGPARPSVADTGCTRSVVTSLEAPGIMCTVPLVTLQKYYPASGSSNRTEKVLLCG